MLPVKLLRDVSSISHFATASRVKYIGTGVTLLSVGYAFLPPTKKKVIRNNVGSAIRFARSLKIGVTISLDYLITPLISNADYTEIHRRSADQIYWGCVKNGGIYVKVGQGLAAVNHVLPKEYIESLSALHDKCLTREKDEIEEIFLQDFGKKPEELFREFESEPVAAASLAQVYKGETLDGNKVAIKVQYIDLYDRFVSDLKSMMFLAKIISIIHPKFNLQWVFNEIIETLEKELDFVNEGKNSEQCAKDLKKFEYAYVPKVYWELTNKRILTMEWIDGVKITDMEGIKMQGLDLVDVDKKLITLMGEQIFHTGFVHADPHPGNIFVRKGKNNTAQIVLLDHGLYEHLSEKARCSLCNFWECMVLKNDRLLKVHAKDLNVEDHVVLAEILTQAPYKIDFTSCSDNTQAFNDYVKVHVQERFDKITVTLRSLPSNVLLVIRNLNAIRAIIKDHGDIINRYKIMARIATRGKYQISKLSYYNSVCNVCNVVRFEFRLWWYNVVQWILNVYLNLLELVGKDVTKVRQML